jgi:multicomponent Na+:H+ antiporter subunit A
MEAPTPVSAYLHSATMVKGGVYLIARMNPVLGGTDLWLYCVTLVGAATMVVTAYMALRQSELKRILAYSTISTLGALTMLLGMGTPEAARAAMVMLLAHALYKAALFLVAGIIDHETGTRDINHLSGLRRAMPLTAAVAAVAAASMAAIPPLFGFIAKEKLLEATFHSDFLMIALTGAAVAHGALMVTLALMVGVRPFFGVERHTPRHPHEAPFRLVAGPALLALAGLILGAIPTLAAQGFVSAGTSAVIGETVKVKVTLWSGFNIVLLLTLGAFAAGLAAYAGLGAARKLADLLDGSHRWGPLWIYNRLLDGVVALAELQTRILQSGYLRIYVLLTVAFTVGLVGATLLVKASPLWPEETVGIRFYEAGLAGFILIAGIVAAAMRSRLAAIIALGAVGYGVAGIFLLFGAPDIAMTQILIETLAVVLFVFVFYHLPSATRLSRLRVRLRDIAVALSAGALITTLMLVAIGTQGGPPVSEFFVENSVPAAHGRNIVNVILVDFRALDTLGEIAVLAVAGLGIFALLKMRLSEKEREE